MQSIRIRLLAVVLLAALIPALPLSLVVRNLLERSLNPDLQAPVVSGLEAGLEGSRGLLRHHKHTFVDHVDRLWRPALTFIDPMIEKGAVVLDGDGRYDARALLPDSLLADTPATGDVMRHGHWLLTTRRSASGRDVVFGQQLPVDLVDQATAITSGLSLMRTLQLERSAILRSYVLPFLLVYAALLSVALVVASVVAGRLARPLTALAAGARHVGAGHLDTRVETPAGGEIGDLVDAFNSMTSELAIQRRRLVRLEKMAAWRDMSRVLAHEIKNPLTPILLAVQETRRSYTGDDPRFSTRLAECDSIVSEEVEGLRNLVRSFSDFARMPLPEPSPEHVGDLLDDLCRLYGDCLETIVPASPLNWSYDAPQLRRALVNLIDNGLAACTRAGREVPVEVTVEIDEGTLRWSVRDVGDGIPSDHLESVFEPDFTTGDGGMGLGLPIVKGIAEAHGGDVIISSSSTDGTTMTIVLPPAPTKEPQS